MRCGYFGGLGYDEESLADLESSDMGCRGSWGEYRNGLMWQIRLDAMREVRSAGRSCGRLPIVSVAVLGSEMLWSVVLWQIWYAQLGIPRLSLDWLWQIGLSEVRYAQLSRVPIWQMSCALLSFESVRREELQMAPL